MLRRSMYATLSSAALMALVLSYSNLVIAQGRASIVRLGTLGGCCSGGLGINASGQVSGSGYVTGDTAAHAFLYSNGTLQDLGTLGGTYSYGNGINASGQVAGTSHITGNGAQHAFLYSGGSMRDLGTLGGTNSTGNAINASGQVVGSASLSGNSAYRAFLYSGGSMRDLGTLGTGGYSVAYGINASGQVTGWAETNTAADHAFLYSGGSMQDLGSLGGNSTGYAVNASGQVAGASYTTPTFAAQHAFLYSGGSMRDLGTLGGTNSVASGINASGQVIGYSEIPGGGNYYYHAFLYTSGTMFDLNVLGLPGWLFNQALAINDYAQISGVATTTTGYGEAFILTLHPNWQGGDGNWSDASRWSFAGFGAFGITPGAPHDVVINPSGSATVLGGADVTVNSLRVAGNSGQIVTLDLNRGSTGVTAGTTIAANGVLAGTGRLGGALTVNAGGRVELAGGDRMQLTGGSVTNNGTISAFGSAGNPATLAVAGAATNGGQINLQNANVSFLGGLSNSGQINTTFGVANVYGNINNITAGKIIVSNGAQASFYNAVVNNGELRVSAGGAANFFGLVSGAGSFTGTGQSRFEGGFSPGNSPALVTVNTVTAFSASSPILMELGGTTPGSGHDKIVFTNAVTLEGGDLDVVWYGGWSGSAGDVYDLFDWNGTLTGTFGHVLLPTLASGLAWDSANLYTIGAISIAAIPEAETYAMMLAGMGLLGFAARRRRAMC